MVFVAPGGPVADEWSDLALAPATEAELGEVLAGEVPPDHYVAVVQLHDGGAALLCEPGGEPISGRVERSVEGRIRFGMAPSATSLLWIGSGVVGASGLEITGFGLAPVGEESARGPAEPRSDMTIVDSPRPASASALDPMSRNPGESIPPPPLASAAENPDLPPPPIPHVDPPVLDPPILSTSMFPDLPIEAPVIEAPANPIIEPTPTPPPPGFPAIEPQPSVATGRPVSLIFDDGQSIPLTSTLAIGRAPEGSEHAPPDCVVVVVAGDQVSRCHFLIRPTALGAEVVDTSSLNGCFVDYLDRPGSGPQIPVGVPVPIEPGQQLRFGDRSPTVVDRP